MNILRKIHAHKKKLKLIQSFSFEKFYEIFMLSFCAKREITSRREHEIISLILNVIIILLMTDVTKRKISF
jgi:hypothetical protein